MSLHVAFVGGWPADGRKPSGGVEVATTRLAEALTAAGVEVSVVARGAPTGRLLLLRGLRPWRTAVAGALHELRPDVVHGHGILDGGLPATDAGVPSVVSVHGDHASDTRAVRTGAGAELRILAARRLARRVVRRADAIVSVHPDPLVNLPAPPRRFAYIPTIVDEAFRTVEAAPVDGRVLFCGGARRIKGSDLLAEAWPEVAAAVPHATLEVVGWPPGEALPPPLAAAEARGRLAATELAAAMARSAAVVIPSRFEVAPVTLLEAWTVGVPVVATRVGGVPVLAEGAAVLADAEPRAIAAALVRALQGEGPVAELVAEGRRRAEGATPAAVARAHLALYEDLVR